MIKAISLNADKFSHQYVELFLPIYSASQFKHFTEYTIFDCKCLGVLSFNLK